MNLPGSTVLALPHPFRTAIAAAALAFAVTGPAAGALISYNEAIDGDLSNGDPLTTFVLDTAGANTIAGNIGADAPLGTCPTASFTDTDCDSFAFVVAGGVQVVGIAVVTTDASLTWRVGTGVLDNAGALIDVLTGTDSVAGGSLPLTSGSYNVSWQSFLNSVGGTPYTFTITTRIPATVPEPATVALIGVALVIVAVLLRRRR